MSRPSSYDIDVAAPGVHACHRISSRKINELKYRKRRDGIDVIDLGMGNPTDPPEEWVVTDSSARQRATQ